MSFCSSLSCPKPDLPTETTDRQVQSPSPLASEQPKFWISSLQIGLNLARNDLLIQDYIAEEAVQHQLDALKYNDQPRQDYGIEVMYRNQFKQRVWIQGSRTEEEEIFQFTMVQRVGGSWDGYLPTESLLHNGDGFAGALAH